MKIIKLIIIFLISFSLSGCSYLESVHTTKVTYGDTIIDPYPIISYSNDIREDGNSSGNIANEGLITRQGDWVFYSDISASMALYKIKKDGTAKFKLCDDSAKYISVKDEWIYYSNISDMGKIYKIKTDGTGRTAINQDTSDYVTVDGDWIYYIESNERQSIFRMKKNGLSKQLLSKGYCQYLNKEGDWIYYSNYLSGSVGLYKTDKDGRNTKRLTHDSPDYLCVSDGWIYYYIKSDLNSALYKVRVDGTSKKLLFKKKKFYVSRINASKGWVYFSGYDPRIDMLTQQVKYDIYKISEEGSKLQNVEKKSINPFINFLDGEFISKSFDLMIS